MKKIIPEQVIVTCNRCEKEINGTPPARGEVTFAGFDAANHAVGGVKVEFDLCGRCTAKLSVFLKQQNINPGLG